VAAVSPSASEPDPSSEHDRLRLEGGTAPLVGWALIEVRGRHRERYLSSQVTSDVDGLAVGSSQLSALLDRSGRLQTFFYLHKRQECVVLLLPSELVEATVDSLTANLIADQVELEMREPEPMWLALGPEAMILARRGAAEARMPVAAFGESGFVDWSGVQPELPPLSTRLLDALAVVTGRPPRWGAEVGEGMLVNETVLLDAAVSLGRGCFLGQETVTKLVSHRGSAYGPALLDVPTAVDAGTEIRIGGRRAGRVRSVARWGDAHVLHCGLKREYRVDGAAVEVDLPGVGSVPATVRLLPLIATRTAGEVAAELHDRSAALFASGRQDEAEALLERAILVSPGSADAYETLGVMLGRRGEYWGAIELMQQLLEVDPDSVMAHSNMSLYFNHLGRIEEAEEEARLAAAARARQLQREEQARRADRRRRDEERSELARREDLFARVLDLDPDDRVANFGLGEICVETGRYEEAVEHLERALADDRRYSAAYLVLGRAFEGLGRSERALEAYRRGVEVAAERGDLATANRMQGRLAELEPPAAAAPQ
jgi:folate-binding Fe-S cluster repair protein YgfZ/Flp pilus assembly protein TadD